MLFQKLGCLYSSCSASEGGKMLDLIYIRKLLKTNIACAVKVVNDLRVSGHKSNDSFG